MTPQEQLELVLSSCRLYDGSQQNEEENPYEKTDDEFKWWMWKIEFKLVNNYFPNKEMNSEAAIISFCSEFICTGIEKMAGIPVVWEEYKARVERFKKKYYSF